MKTRPSACSPGDVVEGVLEEPPAPRLDSGKSITLHFAKALDGVQIGGHGRATPTVHVVEEGLQFVVPGPGLGAPVPSGRGPPRCSTTKLVRSGWLTRCMPRHHGNHSTLGWKWSRVSDRNQLPGPRQEALNHRRTRLSIRVAQAAQVEGDLQIAAQVEERLAPLDVGPPPRPPLHRRGTTRRAGRAPAGTADSHGWRSAPSRGQEPARERSNSMTPETTSPTAARGISGPWRK